VFRCSPHWRVQLLPAMVAASGHGLGMKRTNGDSGGGGACKSKLHGDERRAGWAPVDRLPQLDYPSRLFDDASCSSSVAHFQCALEGTFPVKPESV